MTLADLQGNVICGYGTSFARFLFVSVSDRTLARGFLAEMLARVTFNESWEANPPDYTLNIAFTHAGMLALGVPAESFEGLDAFTQGMAARAATLGDLGECGPEHWEPGLGDLTCRVGPDRVGAAGARVGPRPRWRGGSVPTPVFCRGSLRRQRFSRAPASTSGFGDGFSQPAIAGANTGPRHGEGTLTKWRRWRELALGEFILGPRGRGRSAAARSRRCARAGRRVHGRAKPGAGRCRLSEICERAGSPVRTRRTVDRGEDGRPLAQRVAAGQSSGPPGSAGEREPETITSSAFTARTLTALRVRWGRTCAARTPATRSDGRAARPSATGCCAGARAMGGLYRMASPSPTGRSGG